MIRAEVPRVRCPEHGIRQLRAPWAEENSRFTALLEVQVIEWLKEASILAVARLLGLGWSQVAGIQKRAVTRGLARRQRQPPRLVGVDETSFRKRHDYVTLVNDLSRHVVLEVADGRGRETLDSYFRSLGKRRCAAIEEVAMDMWRGYIGPVEEHTDARIVFDKFHIAAHLSKAVDSVRRQEHRELRRAGAEILTRSRYLWLMATPTVGQKPPEELPGLRWVSAARALAEDTENLNPKLLELLTAQSEQFREKFGSAREHGLVEGQLPPDRFCTVRGIGGGLAILGPDSGTRFGGALLLAEVAAIATVKEIIPGFTYGAWAESLLVLEDATPLHDFSPIPSYALVQVGRVVAEDRVFCGGYGMEFDPVIGSRVVVLGSWHQAVVPFGPGHSGAFAVVGKDGHSLHWQYAPRRTELDNLVDLQARVDEAVAGNLFSLTADLIHLEEGSRERRKFGRKWSRRVSRGCRPISVEDDGETMVQICINPKASAEEKARFYRAWTQQCLDGGPPPSGKQLSDGHWTDAEICER